MTNPTATQYDDEIMMDGGSESGGSAPEDLFTVEGRFLCEIFDMVPFMGTKFESTELEQKIRVIYRSVDDPANNGWVGYKVDEMPRFVTNLANEKARLHILYAIATGVTPQPGVKYKMKADMIGRRVWVDVGSKVSKKGYTYPKVNNVSAVRAAPPPPPARKAAPATDGLPADPLANA